MVQFGAGLMDRQRLELRAQRLQYVRRGPAGACRASRGGTCSIAAASTDAAPGGRAVVTPTGSPRAHPLLRRHPVPARTRQRRADDGDVPRAGAPGPRRRASSCGPTRAPPARDPLRVLRPAAACRADDRARARAGVAARAARGVPGARALRRALGAPARRCRPHARPRRRQRCSCACRGVRGRRSCTSRTASRRRSGGALPAMLSGAAGAVAGEAAPPRGAGSAGCGAARMGTSRSRAALARELEGAVRAAAGAGGRARRRARCRTGGRRAAAATARRPGPSSGTPGICTRGRGVDVLLAALERLPGVRGLIVGGHPGEPDLGRVARAGRPSSALGRA